jgi:hypothetical protein
VTRTGDVFGKHGEFFLPILEVLHGSLSGRTVEYGFVVAEQFAEVVKADPVEGMRLYWDEMLQMVHMASATSLLRARAWLRASSQAIEDRNSLAFTACLRAFLEATSDTYDALHNVAETLAEHRQQIVRHLAKQAREISACGDVEDQLIHFLMAREVGRNEDVPPAHRRRQAADYFESVDRTRQGPLRDLYRELCEYSHPSHASVFFFMEELPDGRQRLAPAGARDLAVDLVTKHLPAVETAFECGINSPLLALKVLNEFPLPQFHTPPLSSFTFVGLPVGKRIGQKLGKAGW